MPTVNGVSHIALTVTDVARSAELYKQLFGLEQVAGGVDDFGPIAVLANPTLMIGFRTHTSTAPKDRFDPTRVGLDHVGFGVDSKDELEKWRSRLDELGIPHSDIVDDPYGTHLNAKDPDNIAIEFFYFEPPA